MGVSMEQLVCTDYRLPVHGTLDSLGLVALNLTTPWPRRMIFSWETVLRVLTVV